MPTIISPQLDINQTAADLNEALKEGAYVALGLGVIGFQRAQVQRVELTKQLNEVTEAIEEQLDSVRTRLTELAKAVDERVQPIRKQIDEQIDRIEQYLPGGARNVVQSVRSATTTPEQLLRSAVGLN
jgi:ElaB/YqjD/DUF883 family membrane-anchored ribosome-binding protein